MFALDPAARIKTLSKGQKARAGLLIALAYRPELLVLDEPSSGLDPIVRRDILGAVIRTIAHEGRTVLFSSHLLDEVEQVADHVTMISQGRVVLSAPLDAMKESHRCIDRALSGTAASPARRRGRAALGRGRPGLDGRVPRRLEASCRKPSPAGERRSWPNAPPPSTSSSSPMSGSHAASEADT